MLDKFPAYNRSPRSQRIRTGYLAEELRTSVEIVRIGFVFLGVGAAGSGEYAIG